MDGAHGLCVDEEVPQERPEPDRSDVHGPSELQASSEDPASELTDSVSSGDMQNGLEVGALFDDDFGESIADLVSRMEPVRPEVVRATCVFQTLRCLASPFRSKGNRHDYYSLSQPAHRMQFWSHSWHGSRWSKILTLYVVQNATAASALSTALAVGPLALSTLRLPSLKMLSFPSFVPFCFVIALVTYGVVSLFWRRRQLVFMDRICIHQSNHLLKAEGLISMGAILKSSDSMLVLWDPTYQERLWCLFEMAAFLRSRPQNQEPHLIIWPTVLGPVTAAASLALVVACGAGYASISLTIAVGLGSVPFWLLVGASTGLIFFKIADAMRQYCREVESLQHQLQQFRLDDALSYCCTVGHVGPSGEQMLCDRLLVRRCIDNWFGSVDQFERTVRTEVLEILVNQLSTAVVTYRRVLEAPAALFWLFLDLTCAAVYGGDMDGSIRQLLRGLAYWLAVTPTVLVAVYRSANAMRRERKPPCLDRLVSLLLLCFGLGCFLCFVAVEESLVWLLRDQLQLPISVPGAIFAVLALSSMALAWQGLKPSLEWPTSHFR